MNTNMIAVPSQTKKPTASTPKTPSTVSLAQFKGDLWRVLYLHRHTHGHTHTLVEFCRAMDEVFKQMHKEFTFRYEVSYDQWVSRKNQWDKDFNITNGGLSKEDRDGLSQYPTFLECNEGKIRPRPRQPGYWLRSDLDLNSVTQDQPLSLGKQQSDKYLREHGPVQHQTEDPWISGGSLNNVLQNSLVQPSAYNEAFTERHLGAHGDLTISPSYLRPAGVTEWNAEDPTLPYRLSSSTDPSFPVQPTSFLQDTSGGRGRTNISISSDPSANYTSAARARDNSYPQGQPRT